MTTPITGPPAARGSSIARTQPDLWRRLGIYTGYGVPDLTQWAMSCTLWFCDEWNDETSSVWADNSNGQTAWEHIGYSGSALWTPGGSWRSYLDPLGWNDRVSSFISW